MSEKTIKKSIFSRIRNYFIAGIVDNTYWYYLIFNNFYYKNFRQCYTKELIQIIILFDIPGVEY